jgi:hypothetical protein
MQYTPLLFQVQVEERRSQESAGTSMLLQLALNFGCTNVPSVADAGPKRLLFTGRDLTSEATKLTYNLLPMLLPSLISQDTATLSPGSSALWLRNNVSERQSVHGGTYSN